MYYEESVIDGVLHWRGTPDGAFEPRTAKELTQLLLDLRKVVHDGPTGGKE